MVMMRSGVAAAVVVVDAETISAERDAATKLLWRHPKRRQAASPARWLKMSLRRKTRVIIAVGGGVVGGVAGGAGGLMMPR
jgi:3-dehydroquinate synthetase